MAPVALRLKRTPRICKTVDKKNPLNDDQVIILVNLQRIHNSCLVGVNVQFDELTTAIFVRLCASQKSLYRTLAYRFLLALQGSSDEEQDELMPVRAARFLMQNSTSQQLAAELELDEIGVYIRYMVHTLCFESQQMIFAYCQRASWNQGFFNLQKASAFLFSK